MTARLRPDDVYRSICEDCANARPVFLHRLGVPEPDEIDDSRQRVTTPVRALCGPCIAVRVRRTLAMARGAR